MGDLLEKALSRIDTIIRYIAPGFVALFVILACATDIHLFQNQSNSVYPAWAIVVAAALAGVLVYSVHTGAIVHGVALLIIPLHKRYLKYPEISEHRSKRSVNVMFDLDTERWLRRCSRYEEVRNIQDELDKWAAMLNFLYCSSYLMILIPLYFRFSHPSKVSCYWWHLSCLGALMLLFALISSFRIITRQFWALKRYPQGKKQDK